MRKLEAEFEELFQCYKQLDKYTDGVARCYNGIRLFPSEIHLLVFIEENQQLNVTEIAEKRNISKGALSKVLGKLTQKELLEKHNRNGNSKNVYYSLTKLGHQAYQGHTLFHEKHNRKHTTEMTAFLKENYNILETAIRFTKQEIQEYINELQQEEQ